MSGCEDRERLTCGDEGEEGVEHRGEAANLNAPKGVVIATALHAHTHDHSPLSHIKSGGRHAKKIFRGGPAVGKRTLQNLSDELNEAGNLSRGRPPC